MEADQDLASVVLDAVSEALSVDEEWSVRNDRSLVWWPSRIHQRIWVDPPRDSHGEVVTRVHAEVPLLRGVAEREGLLEMVSSLNGLASLSALIYDADGGRISLHGSGFAHAGNAWLVDVFKSAVALQLPAVDSQVEVLTGGFGGEPDLDDHPTSGAREEPDEILEIGDFFAEAGARPSPFSAGDFRAFVDDGEDLWLIATHGDAGASVELRFSSDVPATLAEPLESRSQRRELAAAYAKIGRPEGRPASDVHGVAWTVTRREDAGIGTALLQIRADEPHPALGSGLIAVLRLPVRMSAEEAAVRANELNRQERDEWTGAHALGAWCTRGEEVAFVSFLPNLVLGREGSRARRARLVNIASAMVIRSSWAAKKLAEEEALS